MPHAHETVKGLRACRRVGCADTTANVMTVYRLERQTVILQAQKQADRNRQDLTVYWDNARACFAFGASAPWHATSQVTIKPTNRKRG